MSTTIATILDTGRFSDRDLALTEFVGPAGRMLQLTQGLGTELGPDEPGFVQLSLVDAYQLIAALAGWLKSESSRRADVLAELLAQHEALRKTWVRDAVECQRFIDELAVLGVPVRLLDTVREDA
ncbi:hypothetical protein JCM19379_22850 [Methyloparacoccus murrellii]